MTGAIVEKQQSPPLRIERKDIEPMEGNKEKEQNNTKQETDDVDKNTKNFFETVREIEEKEKREEAQKEEERRLRIQKKEEKEREEYAKKLRQEKIELMRMKQGVIDESEMIKPEEKEEKKYTLGQKIGNFFYQNKWWLGFAVFLVLIGSYFVYDTLTREKPDIIMLMLVSDSDMIARTSDMETLFEEYVEDTNGDGKVCVSIYNIPITENMDIDDDLQLSYRVKLMSELQLPNDLIIIADSGSDETIKPEKTLEDLSEHFSDNSLVKDYGFYLKDTDIAEKLGLESIADDVYIGIRKVQQGTQNTSEMQENFDKQFPVLENIISEFS